MFTSKDQESGFTLVELLIVVVIIGILAVIAIPIFVNQQKAATDAKTKADIKNVALMVKTWMAQHPMQHVTGPGGWVTGSVSLGGVTQNLSSGTVVTFDGSGDFFYVCAYNPNGASYASQSANLCWNDDRGSFE